MYHQKIMDYYNNTLNRRAVPNPNLSSGKSNPSCGDEIVFTGTVQDGIITDLAYEGAGCILSQGVASMLCDRARGASIATLLQLDADAILEQLELKVGPNRLQCIQLPLDVLQEALKKINAQ